MKKFLFFCAAILLNSCTYFELTDIVKKPKPVLQEPCNPVNNVSNNYEIYLYDTQDQVIKNITWNSSWTQASNMNNYPAGVNPFHYNNVAFSFGAIAEMSNNQIQDEGGCFRLKFVNNAYQPIHIEVGFWNAQTNSFTKYVPEMDACLDYDTDCCWDNNDNSFYFLTQQNQFIDLAEFRDYREVFCFKIFY